MQLILFNAVMPISLALYVGLAVLHSASVTIGFLGFYLTGVSSGVRLKDFLDYEP